MPKQVKAVAEVPEFDWYVVGVYEFLDNSKMNVMVLPFKSYVEAQEFQRNAVSKGTLKRIRISQYNSVCEMLRRSDMSVFVYTRQEARRANLVW